MIIIYGAEGKMIFRNIEFHNVAELEAIPGWVAGDCRDSLKK